MVWTPAPDITTRIAFLVTHLDLRNISPSRLFCFRSTGTTSRATARIWSLPKIWQQALHTPPGYCLEVISERFDSLDSSRQEKVLIHELLHIPKAFTGGLVPHRNHKHRTFRHYRDTVENLYNSLALKSFEHGL